MIMTIIIIKRRHQQQWSHALRPMIAQRLKGFNRLPNSISACDFNAGGDMFAYAIGYDWSKVRTGPAPTGQAPRGPMRGGSGGRSNTRLATMGRIRRGPNARRTKQKIGRSFAVQTLGWAKAWLGQGGAGPRRGWAKARAFGQLKLDQWRAGPVVWPVARA